MLFIRLLPNCSCKHTHTRDSEIKSHGQCEQMGLGTRSCTISLLTVAAWSKPEKMPILSLAIGGCEEWRSGAIEEAPKICQSDRAANLIRLCICHTAGVQLQYRLLLSILTITSDEQPVSAAHYSCRTLCQPQH